MGDKNKLNWREAVANAREHSQFLREELRLTNQVIRVSFSDLHNNFNSIKPIFFSLVSSHARVRLSLLLSSLLQLQPFTNMARS